MNTALPFSTDLAIDRLTSFEYRRGADIREFVAVAMRVAELEDDGDEPCSFCNIVEVVTNRGDFERADYRLLVGDWRSDDPIDHEQSSVPICATCLIKRTRIQSPADLHAELGGFATDEGSDTSTHSERLSGAEMVAEEIESIIEETDDIRERATYERELAKHREERGLDR